jgi:hypothetical protein
MNKNLFNYDDETLETIQADDGKAKVAKPTPPKKQKKPSVVEMTYDKIQKEQCCADCGYKEITKILVCHHLVPGTVRQRSGRAGRTMSPRNAKNLTEMYAELAKCVWVCYNCHAKRHYNRETGKIEWHNVNLR